MTILGALLFLVVLGGIVALINAYAPLTPGFKKVINIFAIVIAILCIIGWFGGFAWFNQPIPRVVR